MQWSRGGGRPRFEGEYEANSRQCVGLSRDGFILFKNINNVGRVDRHYIRGIECELKEGIRICIGSV